MPRCACAEVCTVPNAHVPRYVRLQIQSGHLGTQIYQLVCNLFFFKIMNHT